MKIVTPESAVMNLDNELVIPMGADHRSLCKFGNATDPRYELVKHAIEELVAHVLNAGRKYDIQQSARQSLFPYGQLTITTADQAAAVEANEEEEISSAGHQLSSGRTPHFGSGGAHMVPL